MCSIQVVTARSIIVILIDFANLVMDAAHLHRAAIVKWKRLGCNCDASGLRCHVTMGSHRLSSKKRDIRLEHDFIEYKGFVWEYGCYGTRILDMNDPLFPSQRPTPLRRNIIGKSSCSYSDALLFLEHTGNTYTSAKYSLVFNNCQDFAAAFSRWLLDDCTIRQKRATRDTPIDLTNYFTQLINTCPLNGKGVARYSHHFNFNVLQVF